MNGHAAAYSNFRRIEGSVTVSPSKISCQTERACPRAGAHEIKHDEVPRFEAEIRNRKVELGSEKRGGPRSSPYLAASCAHFASVVRKEFAAAGGSTSPVSAALNVIMCP